MRVSSSQQDTSRQKVAILTPNDFRQAYSPADGLAVRDPGKRKAQVVQCRLGCTEEDRMERVAGGSVMNPFSLQPCYRSTVHHEVLLRFTSSIVFLDKSLCVALVELERRRSLQPSFYRSALSIHLHVSTRRRSPTDSKAVSTKEGYRRIRAAALSSHRRHEQGSSSGRCRSPLSKHRGCEVEQTAPAPGVNSKAGDLDTRRHRTTLGLLSFRGPKPSNTKPGRQKENADEASISPRSNFRNRQPSFSTGLVDSGGSRKGAGNDRTYGGRVDFCSAERQTLCLDGACHDHPKDSNKSLEGKNLTLKEALELFKPDFISRSQGRLRRLEQKARRRKALSDSTPDLVQGIREDRGSQRRNCTTPDPLSDNLFKPRERSISGREMQLRSRRIYNKLPEVTRKKEEEKKRAVSQTNRLRAEVFKKKILDQVLQR